MSKIHAVVRCFRLILLFSPSNKKPSSHSFTKYVQIQYLVLHWKNNWNGVTILRTNNLNLLFWKVVRWIERWVQNMSFSINKSSSFRSFPSRQENKRIVLCLRRQTSTSTCQIKPYSRVLTTFNSAKPARSSKWIKSIYINIHRWISLFFVFAPNHQKVFIESLYALFF